jgi:Na+/melibiose symporter and related transporters
MLAPVATSFMAIREFDSISDPIMAFKADRTQSRRGRVSQRQVWRAMPIGIIGVRTFSVLYAGKGVKIAKAKGRYTTPSVR